MANSWAVSFVREQPSFEDITPYQLCYWKVTRIYGLTPEEIEDLLTNPDPQYRWDYHTWKNCLDANTRATKSLVDHLMDPSYQVIEAPLSLPEPIFFHTVRAAELRWWNGYLNTYHSFNDLILFRGHYQYSYFNRRYIKTISWHAG
jgi:hypothetical protein